MSIITETTFGFLTDIKENNDKPWFEKHRDRYDESHDEMIQFAGSLLTKMSEYDKIVSMTGKKSLFRIYRDVRFSKDKRPYKHHWAGSMKRDTVWLRGGYYYHIEPGNCLLAAGFWNPNKDDMKLIRDHIAFDSAPLRKIVAAKKFKETWGALEGDKLKTAPKGFPKDHPDIDLIRHKQWIVIKNFSDEEARSEDFVDQCVKSYRAIRPFFDYMSDILTHNLNGEPLY